MDNKEFENRYEKTAKKLRIIGFILLLIGAACVITGMTEFFMKMSSKYGDAPSLFFLNFIGFPFLAGGGVCLIMGYQRKMNNYIISQNAPVAKDAMNYMLDGTSDAMANTAGKVANEINKNKTTSVEGVTGNTCEKCGFTNPAGAKFCAKCGAPIVKKCPYCGTQNDDGAKFCNNCGKSLF